ncbi:glycosyltransferase family 4 protein [Fulvivirgaceae bacterium BMA10]|uniref:Glycosyltransferase family 4 protein n=1 Tax=Splendidivirga corallicola TaxID=3051826 RepID=A0ABT8KQS8_9BACT|nr:glycosyltransferase family 4 protein [Fulvivirgaceae bacterium BMA10]
MSKKILFISNEASRTGAPIVLLNFLKWLKENTDLDFLILSLNDGPLIKDFQKLAPTYTLKLKRPDNPTFSKYIAYKLKLRFIAPIKRYFLLKKINSNDIGLVYANTIANGTAYHKYLSNIKAPLITHIHELDRVIKNYGEFNWENVEKYSDHFIAASGAVKQNLVDSYEIAEDKVDVVHSFVPVGNIARVNEERRREMFQLLNIKEGTFVVGGVGALGFRKGVDLFVQTLIKLSSLELHREVCFVWVGANLDSPSYKTFISDLKKLKLEHKIRFIERVPNPADYFSTFDVFLMTSREDPFPLVCLENASLKTPVICFENAGGISEFVEQDAGFVVPYLDISAMTSKLELLMKDEALRKKLGEAAAQKVKVRHDVPIASAEIKDIIMRFIDSQ